MSLTWAIKRLSSMDGREISYRIGKAIQARLEQMGFGLAGPAEPANRSAPTWVTHIAQDFDRSRYCIAADRIMQGRFDVFALEGAELGFPPNWNKDPKTGTQAPLAFGKLLDYRDERLVGDIKYLWEPNRHLELVTLAQAWHLSGDTRYCHACRILLDSWLDQCPYPRGPNWTSSLEHAVRLVNWSFAWHLLGGDQSVALRGNRRPPLPISMAAIDLPALPFYSRAFLSLFVGQQPPVRGADRAFHRRIDLAALGIEHRLARPSSTRTGNRSVKTSPRRRGRPRASHLVSPFRCRHDVVGGSCWPRKLDRLQRLVLDPIGIDA